jgi:hypothetical protein
MAESGTLLNVVNKLYSTQYECLTFIDYSHNEIHEGDLYSFNYISTSLGASSWIQFQLNCNSTLYEMHVNPSRINNSGGLVRLSVYELTTSSTFTSSTNTIQIYNLNRLSTKVATMSVTLNPTNLGSSEIKIKDVLMGSTESNKAYSSPTPTFHEERILKKNSTYVLRVENLGNTGYCGFQLVWYENGVP